MVEAAPNENASDKAKENTAKKYRVEILSTEILEESIIDGVKVVKYKQKIKQIDKPTMKDFLEDSKGYIAFLESEYGEEGKKMVAEKIANFAKSQATSTDEYEIETVKYGDQSIIFEPKTHEYPWSSSTIKDPINIVFKGNGNSGNAKTVIDNNASHGWKGASGWPQYVQVDETIHGGISYWSVSGDQLEEGSYYGERYHLRIFNGGDDSHGQFDKWSLGAVHKETWNGSGHTLNSNTWETSESELKSDLTGATGVSSVSTINLSNSGYYQGYWNGGVAGLITLN